MSVDRSRAAPARGRAASAPAAPKQDRCAEARPCGIVADLVAAQLQVAADAAWLRYDVARRAGDVPMRAVEIALEATARDPSLEALRAAGFDPAPFRSDLERALCLRAAHDLVAGEGPST